MQPTLKMSDARVRHLLALEDDGGPRSLTPHRLSPPRGLRAVVGEVDIVRRETHPAISGTRTRSSVCSPTMPAMAPARPDSAEMFERTLASLTVVLDPVYDARALKIGGWSARVVCDDPTLSRAPGQSLEVLHRRARQLAATKFAEARTVRPDGLLFVDVSPADLLDPELYAPDSPLANVAESVVLQLRGRSIGEAVMPAADLVARISVLRFLGFRIAVADLELAPARLSMLADIMPEFVKIDATLIAGMEASEGRKLVIEGLLKLCSRLGAIAIAEGVATLDLRAALVEIGCPLLQGALHDAAEDYARPVSRRASDRPRRAAGTR